ncbi:MAG TPA: YihY/virulence factor BrkB family protein [Halanaerobiales bacterium]|nr:YihY/virulence factor BrkB family protein [Halanaerobiales bacterium]
MENKLNTKEKTSIVFKKLVQRYKKHDISAYSALMAFFLTLSLFPFLIILFAVLGQLSLDTNWIISALELFFPAEVHGLVMEFIRQNIILKDFSVLSLSVIGALWASSRGIRALMLSLNMAYEVKETRNYFLVKLIDILYTLLIIIGIVFLLTLPNIGREFLRYVDNYITIDPQIIELIGIFKLTALPITIVFIITTLYMLLPNRKQSFKKVIPGTVFTIVGWTLLSYLFSLFINYIANYSLIYGSLSTIIILMLWLYFSSIILILGGELNSVVKEL